MQPLVSSDRSANPRITSQAAISSVLIAIVGFIGLTMLAAAQLWAYITSAVLVGLAAWGISVWVLRMGRAQGRRPVLLEKPTEDGGVTLKRASNVDPGKLGRGASSVTLHAGDNIWIIEKQPDSSLEFLIGVRPYLYLVLGAPHPFEFASFARLRPSDLEPLRMRLESAGVAVTMALERTAEQGPAQLSPVAPGTPQHVVVALPAGEASLGFYSDRSDGGPWVPREYAYGYGLPVVWGTHLPVTLSFGADPIDPTNWQQLAAHTLPAFADQVVVASKSGAVQLAVPVPQGFRTVYLFRAAGPTGALIHLHLDGAAPA